MEGSETTETQYSTMVHVVSMLAFLMYHQGKDYHWHLICISHQLHADFLYTFVWHNKRCFLYCL